jgi:c(7)-type cytochrome triheme protein
MPITKRASLLLAAATCLAALACLFGSEKISRAQEAANKPALPGGFAPLDRARGGAISYWERDGGPINMQHPWRTLQADGDHDPNSDAIKRLQSPEEALRNLPRAGTGNFVDWVAALKSGAIDPRADVATMGQMKVLNLDVTLRDTRSMPTVTFSHAVHTEWLACSNCHDALFKAKAGANDIRMIDIFDGKACGVCHGTVAFPPDQCFRCHNGPRHNAEK